jgi:prepilin-type N-terminal cleavage/methylation domain-containing protein
MTWKPAIGPVKPAAADRAFTLIELLAVIAIIGVLAALIVGGAGLAKVKGAESRVRAELERLTTAIESYKAAVGYYPPDNVVRRSPYVEVNPVTNQLYYELLGTIYFKDSKEFQTARGRDVITEAQARQWFNTDGFVNSVKSTGNTVADAKKVKDFLGSLKPDQKAVISPSANVLVLAVPVPWPRNRSDQPVRDVPGLNPWRYVSTNPTNNPGRFDLWAEIFVGGKIKVLSNWRKEPVPRSEAFPGTADE